MRLLGGVFDEDVLFCERGLQRHSRYVISDHQHPGKREKEMGVCVLG